MGAAGHLGITLDEYDGRIRSFVPWYEEMIAVVAAALGHVGAVRPAIVDIGIGTGALSAACLEVRPDARLIGIDADPAMLGAARDRLHGRADVRLTEGSFLEYPLPAADAMVACIALHHIAEPDRKREFFRQAFHALRPGGWLINADCMPGSHALLAAHHRESWLRHLDRSYARSESEAYLHAWAAEDTYFPLESELGWMAEAGFMPDVLWRRDGFAVVAGCRSNGAEANFDS